MPTIPIRRRLLQELDELERHTKRARLESQITELLEDSPLSDADTDSDSDGLSVVSLASSLSLELDSSSDFDISDSASSDGSDISISDLEARAVEAFDSQIENLRHELQTTRILQPRAPIKKAAQIQLLDAWRNDNLLQYRKKIRVDPSTFDELLKLIQNHPIFYNNSNIPQVPVPLQLAVFLNRAGHYGNGASPDDIGQWAGISTGCVVRCTNRVMVALSALHDEAIHLPTAEEKESAKRWVEAQSCPEWRDGFLLVDGTKMAIFQRPGLHGDAWFDKNKDYSLDCQVS